MAWTEFSKRLCDHSFCTYYVRSIVRSMYVVCVCMYVVICKIDHCIHIHWCIVMGLGHNDPREESHMWPQQTWGQRSCRGQWPLVQVSGKKDQRIHILWCIYKSNITMIAKVCARESRRDSWFENRLVIAALVILNLIPLWKWTWCHSLFYKLYQNDWYWDMTEFLDFFQYVYYKPI